MARVDFHNHSNCSDGLLSPSEMVERAHKNNVKYFALTDHDTISGLDEASKTAEKLDINFIPGIELSTEYNNESIHILGFFKDDTYKNPKLVEFLQELKNRRIERMKKMVNKLKEEFNISVNINNVLKAGNDVVARPHVAREIINEGYNYTFDEIFKTMIGKGCPAYVPINRLSTEEGIDFLHKYNALVFLAHPVLIKYSKVEDFLKFNFDGIESIYYQNSEKDEKYLVNLAKKNNLLISAGSDCHGDFINDTRHGDIGSKELPDKYLIDFLNKYMKKDAN